MMEEHERKIDEWKKKRDSGYETVMQTYKKVTELIDEAQEGLIKKPAQLSDEMKLTKPIDRAKEELMKKSELQSVQDDNDKKAQQTKETGIG
jgi:hypothetical protein